MPDQNPYGDKWYFGSDGYKGGDATQFHYFALRKSFPVRNMAGRFNNDLTIEGRYLDNNWFSGILLEHEVFPDQANVLLPDFERVFDTTAAGSLLTRQENIVAHEQDLANKIGKLNPSVYLELAATYGITDATVKEHWIDQFVVSDTEAIASHFPHAVWDQGHPWSWEIDATTNVDALTKGAFEAQIVKRAPGFSFVSFNYVP